MDFQNYIVLDPLAHIWKKVLKIWYTEVKKQSRFSMDR